MPRIRRTSGRITASRRLSNLASIHADLFWVEWLCARFEKECASTKPDVLVVAALSAAAIVRYGRVVGTGVRGPVAAPLIASLGAAHRGTHDRIKVLRDKWVAHSVNDMDETRVVVETKDGNVVDVYEESQEISSLSLPKIRALGRLARALNRKVGAEIRSERTNFAQHMQRLPPEVLAGLDRVAWSRLGKQPDKSRR